MVKKQTRKDIIEIMDNIIAELTDDRGWNYKQLADQLGSHWITIRKCCDWMYMRGLIDKIETKNHQWIVFLKKVT